MKKKISMFLAVVMILSFLPAMGVFANTTTNRVTSRPQLPEDYDFSDEDSDLKPPELIIKGTSSSRDLAAGAANFRLELENAEWSFEGKKFQSFIDPSESNFSDYKRGSRYAVVNSGSNYYTDDGTTEVDLNLHYTMDLLADNLIDVTLRANMDYADEDFYTTKPAYNEGGSTADAKTDTSDLTNAVMGTVGLDYEIRIPLYVKVTDEGEARVIIANVGNAAVYGISTGPIPFASVGAGATRVTVGSVKDFADLTPLSTIIIDELIPGTITPKELKLRLTNGFEFTTEPTVGNGDNQIEVKYSTFGGDPAQIEAKYESYGSNNTDKSILVLDLSKSGAFEKTSSKSGSISISGLSIIAEDDDIRKGDVEITVSGAGTTNQSVKVANYVSYDMVLEAEDKELPVLISGRFPANFEDDDIKVLKATFKELTADTWGSRKKTVFSFPDGVKPRAVEIKTENLENGFNSSKTLYNVEAAGQNSDTPSYTNNGTTYTSNWKLDDDGLTVRQVNIKQNKKAKVEMTFWVSVEPGFEGDIVLTAGNEGVNNEVSATVATAVSPFTVDTKSTQYPIGLKNLNVEDITITETVKGAIPKTGVDTYGDVAALFVNNNSAESVSDTLEIYVEDMPIERNSSEAEVTDGDLNIEKVNFTGGSGSSGGRVQLTIKRESTTPSTIKITGTNVRIDRTLPKGDYELRIGGSVCANYSSLNKLEYGGFNKDYYVAYDDYVVVTTDEGYKDTGFNKSVKVTIGSTEIVSGDDIIVSDVAPFIENNHTYVPLAATAEALGMDVDKEIIWNANEKSVMVFTTNRTARLVANESVITVNGVTTAIDSPVLIRNNRTFLPFRVLGELVLGVVVDWDEATRTASYN